MAGLHKWGVYRKSVRREYTRFGSQPVHELTLISHHHTKVSAEKALPSYPWDYIVGMTSWYGHYAEARP